MSSTASPADEHAYFQAIEERFISLRGAPLLLSPADWQLTRRWHESGIPLDLVLHTLDQVFAQREEKGARGRVQGLRYCARAVEAAWESQAEMQATGSRVARPSIEVGARLDSLAAVLGALDFDIGSLADRVAALHGAPDEIEEALMILDREFLEMAASSLGREAHDQIDESVEASLTRIGERLADDEVERARDRLFSDALRRHLGLPVLSLFEDRF